MQGISRKLRFAKKTIGFVPTMGAFHKGHLSLIKKARLDCNTVVVSIFVNPIQFGPNEDFEQYPRDLDKDCAMVSEKGVDLIFAPEVSKFYPDGFCTYVGVEKLGEILCGTHRSGHFRGVTTVVAKLFNIIRPTVAYFGQKDYQQAVIIKKMVRDLSFDTDIEILPIVRKKDGLALSSRNAYLDKQEKKIAPQLYQSLKTARELILSGERDVDNILSQMSYVIEPSVKIDYMSIHDCETLERVNTLNSGKILIALAAVVGNTRLIDNILLDIP